MAVHVAVLIPPVLRHSLIADREDNLHPKGSCSENLWGMRLNLD